MSRTGAGTATGTHPPGDVTAMYYGDHVDAARIVAAPELAAHWREWVADRTVWHLDEERNRAEQGGGSA